MLAKWIFIMMIEGKPEIVSQSPTEALCKKAMVRVLELKRIQGSETIGGCYILTTE